MNSENDTEKLRKSMIKSIPTPEEMREGIKDDNGREKEHWEKMALIYMEKASIPQQISAAKVIIMKGPGIQIEITSQHIETLCSINHDELLPDNLEEIVETIVSTINASGHNASQKMGGAGNVRILEICPPEISGATEEQ